MFRPKRFDSFSSSLGNTQKLRIFDAFRFSLDYALHVLIFRVPILYVLYE